MPRGNAPTHQTQRPDGQRSEGMNRATRRLLLILAGVMACLVATGGAGAYIVGTGKRAAGAPAASAGPHYAALPSMQVTLNDGARLRTLYLRVTLELDRMLATADMETVGPRIADVVGVRMGDLSAGELSGALGTLTVKDMVTVAANHELRPARVRNVLLQQMFMN